MQLGTNFKLYRPAFGLRAGLHRVTAVQYNHQEEIIAVEVDFKKDICIYDLCDELHNGMHKLEATYATFDWLVDGF